MMPSGGLRFLHGSRPLLRCLHRVFPSASPLLFLALFGGDSLVHAHGAVAQERTGGDAYASVIVQPDAKGALVAASIRFPVGSALDPEGEEGTAFVLARALEAHAESRLLPLASRIEVTVARHELLVTLLSPPEHWAEAFARMERVLSADPISEALATEMRDRHLERLVFEAGAPVRAFELERLRLLLGVSAPGARPTAGTLPGLERIDAAGPNRFRDRHLRRGDAVVAIVGPVAEAEVERVVNGPLHVTSPTRPGGAGAAVGAPASPDPVAPARPDTAIRPAAEDTLPPPRMVLREHLPPPLSIPRDGPTAWTTEDRILIDRDLTSTWMTVAWPFPEGTPPLLLEFLGRVLRETVVPSPPDPGFYSAESSVEWLEARPVLLFSATVDPRIAGQWEERILQGMEAIATSPPAGAFFDLGRRRFRNTLLLDMSTPDGRSRWLARMQAERGAIPDLESELWGLTMDGVAEAAEAAGPPRRLLFGPLAMIEDRPRPEER